MQKDGNTIEIKFIKIKQMFQGGLIMPKWSQ